MIRRFAFLGVLVAGSVAGQAPPPDTSAWTAEQWRAAARTDVDAAYRLYRENHPGVHDRNNPGFNAQLDGARDKALAAAAAATGAGGYADALGAFSVGMADHHAGLAMRQSGSSSPTFQWPGFIPAWRGESLFVHYAEPGAGVSRGERILSCDGLEVGALARRNLATSRSYPLGPGEYWVIGGAPFNSTAETRDRRARVCEVRSTSGAVRNVDLRWRDAPPDFVEKRTLARMGERTEIGLTEPRPGVFLIGMPTFSPDDEQLARYQRLFADLRAKRPALSQARTVVIDLRHNQGGSTSWSQQAGRILWGDAAVNDWEGQLGTTQVWWRASKGNTDYVATWPDLFRKQLRPVNEIGWAERVTAGMTKAFKSGSPYFIEGGEAEQAPPAAAAPASPVTPFGPPVYVITHGQCGSACLDAVDLFRAFPNVRLIGAPTASDTNYMDIRSETLPSGLGQVIIPMKVYVGRKRASGAYYTPDILMTSLDWSTAAFLDRIEADLGSRKGAAAR